MEAITPVQYSKLSRTKLGEVFEYHPRLAALCYVVAILEQVSLCDRLKSLGRTQGKARLAHLILSVFSQLRTAQNDHIVETNAGPDIETYENAILGQLSGLEQEQAQ